LEDQAVTRKPRIDPRKQALLERRDKLRAEWERSYAKLRRAVNRMEKARAALARIERQLDKLDEPAPTA
jgi:hypothetical protein